MVAYQDDSKAWKNITLNKRLPVIMDWLMKRVLIAEVVEHEFISSKFLLEILPVELHWMKVMKSPHTAFERHWGLHWPGTFTILIV